MDKPASSGSCAGYSNDCGDGATRSCGGSTCDSISAPTGIQPSGSFVGTATHTILWNAVSGASKYAIAVQRTSDNAVMNYKNEVVSADCYGAGAGSISKDGICWSTTTATSIAGFKFMGSVNYKISVRAIRDCGTWSSAGTSTYNVSCETLGTPTNLVCNTSGAHTTCTWTKPATVAVPPRYVLSVWGPGGDDKNKVTCSDHNIAGNLTTYTIPTASNSYKNDTYDGKHTWEVWAGNCTQSLASFNYGNGAYGAAILSGASEGCFSPAATTTFNYDAAKISECASFTDFNITGTGQSAACTPQTAFTAATRDTKCITSGSAVTLNVNVPSVPAGSTMSFYQQEPYTSDIYCSTEPDSKFTGSVAYAATKSYTLAGGDGEKKICIMVSKPDGSKIKCGASIQLKNSGTTPPAATETPGVIGNCTKRSSGDADCSCDATGADQKKCVDKLDLGIWVTEYGRTDCKTNACKADFSGAKEMDTDGAVDMADYTIWHVTYLNGLQ